MPIRETALARVLVRDAMHTGILTTDASTPLRVVARLMAQQRVHAVAVADPDRVRRPWGIVSALDVAAAAADDTDETAGEAASSDLVAVSAADSLEGAARLMSERRLSHVIVVEASSGHPCGILST